MIEAQLYDEIIESLKDVEDPEIGVNIVDLGLIYDIDSNGSALFITITLTSPACPLTENIEGQIYDALTVYQMPINFFWTFSPPWNIGMMNDDGREQFTAMGGYIPSY